MTKQWTIANCYECSEHCARHHIKSAFVSNRPSRTDKPLHWTSYFRPRLTGNEAEDRVTRATIRIVVLDAIAMLPMSRYSWHMDTRTLNIKGSCDPVRFNVTMPTLSIALFLQTSRRGTLPHASIKRRLASRRCRRSRRLVASATIRLACNRRSECEVADRNSSLFGRTRTSKLQIVVGRRRVIRSRSACPVVPSRTSSPDSGMARVLLAKATRFVASPASALRRRVFATACATVPMAARTRRKRADAFAALTSFPVTPANAILCRECVTAMTIAAMAQVTLSKAAARGASSGGGT